MLQSLISALAAVASMPTEPEALVPVMVWPEQDNVTLGAVIWMQVPPADDTSAPNSYSPGAPIVPQDMSANSLWFVSLPPVWLLWFPAPPPYPSYHCQLLPMSVPLVV